MTRNDREVPVNEDAKSDPIEERIRPIVEEFAKLGDWVDRYRYLVAMGEEIPRLAEVDKTDESQLTGCQYDVWIRVEYDAAGHVLRFRADSDAKIVRGLAALVIRGLDGQTPAAVADAKLEFLDTMGLRAHLSAQRSNGLAAMIQRMQESARYYRTAAGEPGHDSNGRP